ncbi:MAG: molecular chaperone GrpE [Solirubrobacteraceae bacterium]|nr:molecular chaperone GrpE [Solirubrobacteraceae bacterium]
MPNSPANDGSERGPEDSGPERPESEARELTIDAPNASAELAQMEDRYKRALADLDNYRKRTNREIERRVAERDEALLRDWLDVLDSVERALRMDPQQEGMRAVLDQMEAILARRGVQRIGEIGEPFDPERHEAIQARPAGDVPARSVVDVARSGFGLGGRVLRPAQVVVSRAEHETH